MKRREIPGLSLGPMTGTNSWHFDGGEYIYASGHPTRCRFQAVPPPGWEGEYKMDAVCDTPEDAALWLAERGWGPWAGREGLPPSVPHDVAACPLCKPREAKP